ncbi:MAG TPA: hypothetical protein VFX30_13025 [bacterium]|nr:hypothetical protein [bacterium]
MPLAPLIDRLAFLPAAELAEALSVFRGALAPLGADLLLNERIDRELPAVAIGNARISPQLVTHLFEWTRPLETFGESRSAADPDFAARWRRLMESAGASAYPIFGMAPRRQGRDMKGLATTPVVSHLLRLFEAPPDLSCWPAFFHVDGRTIAPGDRSGLNGALRRLFGRDVSLDDFLNAFRVDAPGYGLKVLLAERETSTVLITGRLADENGKEAGAFQRFVGLPPPAGGEWRAMAVGYNPAGNFEAHTRRGLARGLHQRFLGFLHRLGVDRLYLAADKSGHYVWPHLGFRHREAKETAMLKEIFRDYLQICELWSAETEKRWEAIGESWDIAEFEAGNRKIGRDFLLSLEGRLSQNLYFETADLNDAGWKRLFKIP